LSAGQDSVARVEGAWRYLWRGSFSVSFSMGQITKTGIYKYGTEVLKCLNDNFAEILVEKL
jgi:hypothetical protein